MTELGEIPNEWEVKTLNEFIISNSYGPRFSAELYDENGNCRVIRGTDVIINGKVNYEGIPYANIENDVLEKHKLIKGDLVVVTTADCGVSFVFNDEGTFIPSAYMVRLRFNDKINPCFVNKFFDTKIIKKQVEQHIRKGTIANLPGSDLLNFKIIVPTILEQKKIASILSTVDEQIDNVDALIEKNKELKKGLMQTLLTKGIGHTRFKKTEIGEIPEEWEVKKLGDIFKLSSGNFLSQKNIVEGCYPVYGGNGVNGYHNEYMFQESKLVIGRVGAKCGCVCLSQSKAWITDNALYISEKMKEFDDKYMYYLLDSINLNSYANQNAQPVISGQKIYGIYVAFPNINEQIKITKILSQIDEKIEEYENKKQKLEELKKGLMQKLLTGSIRVF